MARFYGIYIKGNPNEILDLTRLPNFERTSNYKSPKLYSLKDLLKLTTSYDNEMTFKLDLFYNNIISLDDITREIVIRSCGNTKEDKKMGKPKDIIYKSCIDLFKPAVLKEAYLSKTILPRDYKFLINLIKEFRPYNISYDTARHTSEIFVDEIKSILIYYNQSPDCDCTEQLKLSINNFINHEMYYVIGEESPNGYDRQAKYKYRTDNKTGKKSTNIQSMYKLVLFYIHNSNDTRFINNNINIQELNNINHTIEDEEKKHKTKLRKKIITNIEGQMKIGE